jgi:hypothetical protein
MMLPPAGSRPAASPISPHPHNVWLARSDLRRRLSDYESGALHAKLQASEAVEPPEGDAPSSSRYQRDASLTTLRRQKMAENRGHAPQRDGPADPDSSRSRSSNGLFSLGRRVRDCTGDLLHVGQALCLTELRDEKVAADPGDAPGTAGSEPAALLLRQSAIESSWSRWKELHLRCRSLGDAFTARCIAVVTPFARVGHPSQARGFALSALPRSVCHTWIHMGARVGFAPTTFAL